ncbi:WD40-repeat-containing domain protein, partial [Mycena maculata]
MDFHRHSTASEAAFTYPINYRRIASVSTSDRNSKMVTSFTDFSMEISDTVTGQLIDRLLGHTDTVNSVAFSVDGTQLVSASSDMTVRLWDMEQVRTRGSPIRGHSGPVMGAAFSSCTRKIASTSLDETIRIWDAGSGNELMLLKQRIPNMGPISFCQEDSKLIFYEDSTLSIFDTETDGVVNIPTPENAGDVFAINWAPEGSLVVINSRDSVRVWNTESKTLVSERYFSNHRLHSFSSDGLRIAS